MSDDARIRDTVRYAEEFIHDLNLYREGIGPEDIGLTEQKIITSPGMDGYSSIEVNSDSLLIVFNSDTGLRFLNYPIRFEPASISLHDIDNDGDLDLLVFGKPEESAVKGMLVYRNISTHSEGDTAFIERAFSQYFFPTGEREGLFKDAHR